MLNQSFTADNFRKIFDYENRKGNYLEGEFFPDIEKITKELKSCALEIRALKKKKHTLPTEDYEEKRQKFNDKKDSLKRKKETLLTRELEKISEEITSGRYRFKVTKVDTKCGNFAYSIEKDANGFFAIKQLQYNLRKLYKVQQSNRYNIINQLSCVLDDPFPKVIFRTDIKSFYESIPNNKLLKKISSEHLLTSSSKKFIKQILAEYSNVSGNGKGVPRGIGISAYLSELYMRKFDDNIQYHPEIVFYARYVDDIVVVISPKPNSDPFLIIKELEDRLTKSGLTLNQSKTSIIDLLQPKNCSLEYLGYTFSFGTNDISLTLSNKRLTKYKKRIELTFQDYISKSRYNEKKARKLLVKRLRFLSGNARLLNNKKNALVGIYFSNNLITDPSCLDDLDILLSRKIDKLTSPELKQRLNDISFKAGFMERRFHKFTAVELARIVEVWKHVT